jgi:hypothetical protein
VYNKKVIGVFLFSISIPLWYLNLISRELPDFQEALELRTTSGIPIYLTAFQQWTFDIVSLFSDALIVSISVGLLYYFIKGLPTYVGLLFGLLSRYAIGLASLCYVLVKDPTSFLGESAKRLDFRLYIILSLQFVLTLCFSYVGSIYGKRADYFDPMDRDRCYLYGVPKRIWFLLLMIAFYPVLRFLSKLTVVQIYEFTDKITSTRFWKDTVSLSNLLSEDTARGVTGLLGHVMGPVCAWVIAVYLFSLGLNAIRNKQVKHRWLRICAVFVFLPVVIIIVPVIRNRTWFF